MHFALIVIKLIFYLGSIYINSLILVIFTNCILILIILVIIHF